MKAANFENSDLLSSAGPAVLRLKLLEATHLLRRRNPPDEIRQEAQKVVAELRKLIAERPCISLVDRIAKEKTLASLEGIDPGDEAADGSANIADGMALTRDKALAKD